MCFCWLTVVSHVFLPVGRIAVGVFSLPSPLSPCPLTYRIPHTAYRMRYNVFAQITRKGITMSPHRL